MGKSSSTFSFNKFPGAFLIASAVIILFYFIEVFILPVNFFTFRIWEAIESHKFFPGNFYPDMKISMVEEGDLGHHTKFAVKRKVEWETDSYGYRKRNSDVTRYRIVILGDSYIAGIGLTQSDILSEVLERRLETDVYPFTSTSSTVVNEFLQAKRFTDNPPDIVIFGRAEGGIPFLPPPQPGGEGSNKYSGIKQRFKSFLSEHKELAVVLMRINKNIAAHYFESRVNDALSRLINRDQLSSFIVQGDVNKNMLFLRDKVERLVAGKEIQPEKIRNSAEIIASYARIFRDRGIRFIFLPIPDRENFHYKYLPVKNIKEPMFLNKLIPELRAKGVEVIDVQKAFEEASDQRNILLYQTDDSHWNADGVKLAADLIEKRLRTKQEIKNFRLSDE